MNNVICLLVGLLLVGTRLHAQEAKISRTCSHIGAETPPPYSCEYTAKVGGTFIIAFGIDALGTTYAQVRISEVSYDMGGLIIPLSHDGCHSVLYYHANVEDWVEIGVVSSLTGEVHEDEQDCVPPMPYTLYRSSSVAADLRIHVATFDASDGGRYNAENCGIAARLFASQPGITVRYWCEAGRFTP